MGVVSVYVPNADSWARMAPPWIASGWKAFYAQLSAWCLRQRIPLYVDATANVYPAG